MKRIVLRVKDGVVCVSAPPKVDKREIDKFVTSKQNWINAQLAKPLLPKPELKQYDDSACLEKFGEIAQKVYPLISDKVRPQPKMYVKDYKSRWGVCFHKRGYIILNKRLFDKPVAATQYVILHEYVHFLVPNHGAKFHKIMEELMPDYRERRKLLKSC